MSEKNPAVTVIIPLYNAEKYIGECLTSLANQTLQDFEIIVADDCSTDNSRAVVENFFANFGGRLKLLELPENSGRPGIPRNFALEAACGKYVYFLDSDDLLSETALEELYIVAEKFSADVVHTERSIFFSVNGGKIEAGFVEFQTVTPVKKPTLETFDIGERIDGLVQKKFLWWACSKLFRREFLAENRINFPATRNFEDFIFVLKCLVFAKNYVRVPSVGYYYRQKQGSLSSENSNVVSLTLNIIEIFRTLDDFMANEEFFRENFRYRYAVLDFFVQGQLDVLSKGFFLQNDYDPAEIFHLFGKKIFSAKPEDNVALTSYLFVAANIFKLCTNRQAAEIDALKNQIAALKS